MEASSFGSFPVSSVFLDMYCAFEGCFLVARAIREATLWGCRDLQTSFPTNWTYESPFEEVSLDEESLAGEEEPTKEGSKDEEDMSEKGVPEEEAIAPQGRVGWDLPGLQLDP